MTFKPFHPGPCARVFCILRYLIKHHCCPAKQLQGARVEVSDFELKNTPGKLFRCSIIHYCDSHYLFYTNLPELDTSTQYFFLLAYVLLTLPRYHSHTHFWSISLNNLMFSSVPILCLRQWCQQKVSCSLGLTMSGRIRDILSNKPVDTTSL